MVITFTFVLLGLAALIYPLRRNKLFLVNSALMIGFAYYYENTYRPWPIFHTYTFLFFVVCQIIFTNITTFFAYGFDKMAAVRGSWRIRENDLHLMEFLGGWIGAFLGQKFFHHKTSKKSFQSMYKLMIVLEFAAIYVILKFLNII